MIFDNCVVCDLFISFLVIKKRALKRRHNELYSNQQRKHRDGSKIVSQMGCRTLI